MYKDLLITVRKSLASSIVEVMKLVNMDLEDNQHFFTEVFTTYLNDIDDVKQKILPQLCKIISLFPKEQHNHLLSTLIREQLVRAIVNTYCRKQRPARRKRPRLSCWNRSTLCFLPSS